MNAMQQINLKKDNYAQFRWISKKVVVWRVTRKSRTRCVSTDMLDSRMTKNIAISRDEWRSRTLRPSPIAIIRLR